MSPIVDSRGTEKRRHSRENEVESGPTYLLSSELLVIAESEILPSSTPTGWLHSETQAVQINLTNLILKLLRPTLRSHPKWINSLKE